VKYKKNWQYGDGEEGHEPYVPRERRINDHVRKFLHWRQKDACKRCGDVEVGLRIHHIVPLEKGGTNDVDNLILICVRCQESLHERETTTETQKE
jgi:5-methylcytosine-specific restriction endonuclease McrA